MNNLDKLRAEFDDFYDNKFIHIGSTSWSEREIREKYWELYQAAHISAVKQSADIANSNLMISWNRETDIHNDCAMDIRNKILALLPTNESEVNNER